MELLARSGLAPASPTALTPGHTITESTVLEETPETSPHHQTMALSATASLSLNTSKDSDYTSPRAAHSNV